MDHGAVWKWVRAQLIAGLVYVNSEATKEKWGLNGAYCSIQRREIHKQEISMPSFVYLLNSLKFGLYDLAVERWEICCIIAWKGVLCRVAYIVYADENRDQCSGDIYWNHWFGID